MKAIKVHQFGEPESMALEEVAEPEPETGQVRLQIAAAGVNPVDTYIRAGTYHIRPGLPYTPGNDGAGRIDAVGPDVASLKVGDRVYCAGSLSGTYAEKAICDSARVFPLPAAVSYAQGASVGVPYGAAYHGLFQRAGALAGDTVLVHGATGGVGTAAVQLAKAYGMTVAATGGTEQGRRQAAEQGADLVMDHNSSGYLEQVMTWTQGRGVDIILEMLANVNLGEDLKVLARNGRVVVIGSRGTVEINPRDAMQKNAAILGMLLGSVSAEEFRRIHAALGAAMASNVVKPLVERELPLAQAPDAHRKMMEAGAAGQIVLVP